MRTGAEAVEGSLPATGDIRGVFPNTIVADPAPTH